MDINGNGPAVQIDRLLDDSDGTNQTNTKNKEPSVQIDKIVEKIHKVLDAVKALESNKLGGVDPNGDRKEGAPGGGKKEGRSRPSELSTILTAPTMPSILVGEK